MSADARSVSLAPNDSISQSPTAYIPCSSIGGTVPLPDSARGAERPTTFPETILWTFDECKKDPRCVGKGANKSRVIMERSVRKVDGGMISSAEWLSIHTTADKIIRSNLLTLNPPPGIEVIEYTKTYFSHQHAAAYLSAIKQLETNQPLLTYCTGNWKAEHTIAQVLKTIRESVKTKQKRAQTEDKPTNTGKAKATKIQKRRRASSSTMASPEPKRHAGAQAKGQGNSIQSEYVSKII